jgi:hypothetical protein
LHELEVFARHEREPKSLQEAGNCACPRYSRRVYRSNPTASVGYPTLVSPRRCASFIAETQLALNAVSLTARRGRDICRPRDRPSELEYVNSRITLYISRDVPPRDGFLLPSRRQRQLRKEGAASPDRRWARDVRFSGNIWEAATLGGHEPEAGLDRSTAFSGLWLLRLCLGLQSFGRAHWQVIR